VVGLPKGGGGNRRFANQGQVSVFQDVPVPVRLSTALLEWKAIQEGFKGRRISLPRRNRLRGIAVCVCRIFGRAVLKLTHVGYEQTRQTAEALSHALE
jgi:hypothetical protein